MKRTVRRLEANDDEESVVERRAMSKNFTELD